MKANWQSWILLLVLLVATASRLPAQEAEADRNLFEKSKDNAAKGDATAQYRLGHCYYHGQGVPKDEIEAAKWYRKAAEQNNAFAQYSLGVCYDNGHGMPKDEIEAVKWYRKAADQHHASSQYNLGYCYYYGQGVTKDEIEAVKWYRKAADQNHAAAQYNLGTCYYYGQGVPKNEMEAVKWYRKAADRDYAAAQYNLGLCYYNGEGVEQNYLEAVKWYRKAAEQGLVQAQIELGYCFAKGLGLSKDSDESFRWYLKAANQGDASGEYTVGLLYFQGEGVEPNIDQALKYLRKAADKKHAEAQFLVGLAYLTGSGVSKEISVGMNYIRSSAENGSARAQYELGAALYSGRGVLIDNAEAVKWNALAAAQGNEDAVRAWNFVYKKELTSEEIQEGQRRAGAFNLKASANPKTPPARSEPYSTRPKLSGSGFFISNDGYLISNNHVVVGASQVRLVTSAGLIAAKVVKVDAANDLALLKAEGRFAAMPVAASRGVKMGGTVATVGFPNIGLQGFAPKLAKGEIASLSGAGDDARYFQISLPVQPGNSGGALVDERGNVVGVVSAKLNASAALRSSGALPENVNYAVKSSYLLSFLESVPDVASKLKEASTQEKKFEDVVKSAQDAAVLVLVY